jgi:hypothetical protein
MLLPVAVIALAASLAAPPTAFDAAKAVLSAPVTLTSFAGTDVKGFPARLSWAPDGRHLHVRVVQRDRWANEKEWHYLVRLADGKMTPVEAEPAWSTGYWFTKGSFSCPGVPDFKFDIETRVKRVASTNSGAGGSIAQNSGDPYGPGSELGPQGQAIISGAQQSQDVTTTTMRLAGQVVSEFVNTPLTSGLFYGWAPEGMAAIAYANPKRGLVLMDRTGARREVAGTRAVVLPAWSPDGSRVAWIEQLGHHKYALKVVVLSGRA